jgi:four helix bundle protein
MGIQNYRDLHVWTAAILLARQLYAISERFPRTEIFGLTQQLRRAAVSVACNIAEGHARGTTNEFVRFIRIARGSLAEIDTQIVLASELGYLSAGENEHVQVSVAAISRMLRRLEQALRHHPPG